ncbi:MAG: hypothetical protein A2Y08_03855 [Planctomycetes bacterium GWA2_40_7]|nr:MAG: hypothetical protein A2Y08_03855 [Planctomycetes bacterium GWA2_40_7]
MVIIIPQTIIPHFWMTDKQDKIGYVGNKGFMQAGVTNKFGNGVRSCFLLFLSLLLMLNKLIQHPIFR